MITWLWLYQSCIINLVLSFLLAQSLLEWNMNILKVFRWPFWIWSFPIYTRELELWWSMLLSSFWLRLWKLKSQIKKNIFFPHNITIFLTFWDLWWIKQYLLNAAIWEVLCWFLWLHWWARVCSPSHGTVDLVGLFLGTYSGFMLQYLDVPFRVLHNRQLFLNFNLFKKFDLM